MSNQERFQQAMNQGYSAAWDQNWELAADFFRKALEEIPDQPSALSNLGLALFEQQKYTEALSCYLRATKVAPSDPVPFEKIARIYERQGKLNEATQTSIKAAELYLSNKDVEKAIDNWVRAISLQPENMMARTRLAMVFERMGRKNEAIREYLATAAIYQHAGDNSKARQVVEYCLQLNPESQDAHQALNSIKRNQSLPKPERLRGATGPILMAEIRQMEKPDPREKYIDPVSEARQKSMVRLASMLFDSADDSLNIIKQPGNRKGVSTITRGTGALSLDNSVQTRILLHVGQAIDAQSRNDDKQAVENLEHAIDLGLNEPAAYFLLGFLRKNSQSDASLKNLQKAVIHTDYALAAHILIGQIYQQLQKYNQSAVAYLHALSIADAAIVPPDQAEELLQSYEPIIAAQAEQTDNEILKKLCINISSQVMRNNWREYLTSARQQLPKVDSGSLTPLGEILLESGGSQVVEAITRIRKLASLDKVHSALEEAYYTLKYAPSYLPLHIQIGELLMQSGHVHEALQKFTLLSTLYQLRGEPNQAVRLLTRVVQMAPTDTNTRSQLISLLIDQGKNQDAIQQTMNLAGIYYQMADLDKTRLTYTEALRLAQQTRAERSEVVQILLKIADIDLQRLDLRQAIRVFEQIRTIEPEDIDARIQLVNLDFRLGQDNSAYTEIDNFIAILENSGKRSKAVEFMNRIIAESSEKLELRKRLADLLVKFGSIPEAVEQLDAIANAMLDAGNSAGAAAMIKAIIALTPPNINDYQDALNQLKKRIG
ncbi:MAG: tetratricopeptide repeat protein [Anaerolineae bacterium]|nr:tetratricopeptide repeat protein [Anaerolineae bacterium]